ncbi:MAG: sulfite exporter TauE/SafE family protein [Betaproteobacteria bacterium]|nr:sulfite exporter TauE/SafE family protein [Betaproteobacteria bacterium]
MEWILSGAPQLLCGFAVGFLICYSGVGGGAIVIPAIVVLFGVPASVAVGTASVFAAATKIAAGAEHWRRGNINGKLCAAFTAAAAPGVLLSAGLVAHYAGDLGESFQTGLRYCIAAAIALSLAAAQFRPAAGGGRRAAFLPAAFAVGVVMGATGVGGGVLIIPALLLLSDETPKRVVGASIIIALALSALTAAVYFGGGQINLSLALWMTAGALLAIKPAAQALAASSQKTVRRVLNAVIASALLLMLGGEFFLQ